MQMSNTSPKLGGGGGGGGGGGPPSRGPNYPPPPPGPYPSTIKTTAQEIANDCVLYKFDGINQVEYILGIIDFTKIESGLYFEIPSQNGITNYSVQSNESVINAFKIESNKDNWVSSVASEQYENKEKNTFFLCIGNLHDKIYTTTGSININSDSKIISTTTVFVEFQNKQYFPGKQSLLSTMPLGNTPSLAEAQAQAQTTVFSAATATKTATTLAAPQALASLWKFLTQKMISQQTYKLLFYLNCVDI